MPLEKLLSAQLLRTLLNPTLRPTYIPLHRDAWGLVEEKGLPILRYQTAHIHPKFFFLLSMQVVVVKLTYWRCVVSRAAASFVYSHLGVPALVVFKQQIGLCWCVGVFWSDSC